MGIDPHKQTHTAVAIDGATGRKVGELTVRARSRGFERLLSWARGLDEERGFAVEDGRHVSGALERHLIARGEGSVRVPPAMMFQARRADRVRGKSDPIDAEAVARAGMVTVTVVPRPSSLATSISPPWFSTMCFTMDRPRPVPPVSRTSLPSAMFPPRS